MADAERDLWVSETFVSLQGEGPSQGAPAAFLRLGRCNLSCTFCDTPYTWDETRFNLDEELTPRSRPSLLHWLLNNSPGRLVVTGGEPLIQHAPLTRLLAELKEARQRAGQPLDVVEIETNGTIEPSPELRQLVQQFNVSPKLANSGQERDKAIRHRALKAFVQLPHAYFKFVIGTESDALDASALVTELGMPRSRVVFMPLASDVAELRARQGEVARLALAERVRFGSRLHLELFGGGRGV